jgi:hypothetical protein
MLDRSPRRSVSKWKLCWRELGQHGRSSYLVSRQNEILDRWLVGSLVCYPTVLAFHTQTLNRNIFWLKHALFAVLLVSDGQVLWVCLQQLYQFCDCHNQLQKRTTNKAMHGSRDSVFSLGWLSQSRPRDCQRSSTKILLSDEKLINWRSRCYYAVPFVDMRPEHQSLSVDVQYLALARR